MYGQYSKTGSILHPFQYPNKRHARPNLITLSKFLLHTKFHLELSPSSEVGIKFILGHCKLFPRRSFGPSVCIYYTCEDIQHLNVLMALISINVKAVT